MINIQCPKCEKNYNNVNLPFYCHCGFYISHQTILIPHNHIDKTERSKPSLIQKAINFTSSVVNHISNGMENVSAAVKEERMSICRACPFFNSTNPQNPTCNKCGCFLEVKTGWASEKCPEGKWHDIKTASSGGCGCNKS